MKKTFLLTLLFLSLLMTLGSCTQNGGYIGDIFGRWHLTRIEGENIEPPIQHGDIFWAFQTDVIKMQRDNGLHSFSVAFGMFKIDGDMLYLDFPEEGQPPFAETGLDRVSELHIRKMTNKEMVLLYNPLPDECLIYYFRKW